MGHRVIQWSTGNVGVHALRGIIRHPDLELVGLWVHSAERPGATRASSAGWHPSGCSRPTTPTRCSALDADCVCYTATADLRPTEAVADMCRILESGKNVVSSSVVPLLHPPKARPGDARAARSRRARRAASSCSRRASIPGSPTTCCRSCSPASASTSTRCGCMEIVNYAPTTSPRCSSRRWASASRSTHTPLLLFPGVLSFAWGGVVKVIAAGLGVEIDEIREVARDGGAATDDVDLGFGVVEAGTTAALRFEVQGIVGGEPRDRPRARHPRSHDDLAPDWPQPPGSGCYRVDRRPATRATRATSR